jgi:hypothetical protein
MVLLAVTAGGFLYSETLLHPLRAAPVTIDGSQTYQVIAGFGVNANSHSWTNDELKPVVDALIDQAGMTLFQLLIQNSNWEATNDNSDANVMNWDYYNTVYSAADFQKFWGMAAYLNQRGITNGLTLRVGGQTALWLGGWSLNAGYENEYAEMIASMLVYARSNQHLQFSEVRAANEPDAGGAGVNMSGSAQYVTMMHDLGLLLDANGMSDVRFSAPDLADANTSTSWMSAMTGDSYLMSKVAHFSLHCYANLSPDASGASNFISQSTYSGTPFWLTEFNVWCPSCSDDQPNASPDNSWTYARGTADYLLTLLAQGASAGVVFEGYDSPYYAYDGSTGENIPMSSTSWSYWGIIAVDDVNASPKTYTPRKGFYTMAQVSKFVRPGAQRINVGNAPAGLNLLAFYNTNNAQFTITGVNRNTNAFGLSCALASLPTIPGMEFYYTSSATNMAYGGHISITNGVFSVAVPADSVFTLTYSNTPAYFLRPTVQNGSVNLVLTGAANFTYQIQVSTDLANWVALTNVVNTNGTAAFTDTNAVGLSWRYYRAMLVN